MLAITSCPASKDIGKIFLIPDRMNLREKCQVLTFYEIKIPLSLVNKLELEVTMKEYSNVGLLKPNEYSGPQCIHFLLLGQIQIFLYVLH